MHKIFSHIHRRLSYLFLDMSGKSGTKGSVCIADKKTKYIALPKEENCVHLVDYHIFAGIKM